jgi:DNA-binding NtrC family response regulator
MSEASNNRARILITDDEDATREMLQSPEHAAKLRQRVIEVNKMKRTILYLDDEVACLNLLRDTFGEEYEVSTASTHMEARRLLSLNRADIIISDQIMPDIKGAEFLREVSEQYPESFRVLLTGGDTVGNLLREISTGVIKLFITKPWTEQDMRRMLELATMTRDLRSNESRERYGRAEL